jgi:hypothetical protein
MASQSAFETLSIELFEDIISQIIRPPHLSALCLVSHTIYQRAVPKLYHSWKYHGLQHPQKSLRNFLQTVIWRPDLASHVRVLDIREWGDCPQLEYEHGCPWTDPFQWFHGPIDDKTEERDEDWESQFRNYDFEKEEGTDEEYQDSDAQSSRSDSSEEYSDSDAEDLSEDNLGQVISDQSMDICSILRASSSLCRSSKEVRAFWDRVMRLHLPETLPPDVLLVLQVAAEEAGLDRDILLKHHASIYAKKADFAVLVACLLASLPNVRHLFIVFTEPSSWRTEQKEIQRMLNDSFKNEKTGILRSLETLQICSALRQSIYPPLISI